MIHIQKGTSATNDKHMSVSIQALGLSKVEVCVCQVICQASEHLPYLSLLDVKDKWLYVSVQNGHSLVFLVCG